MSNNRELNINEINVGDVVWVSFEGFDVDESDDLCEAVVVGVDAAENVVDIKPVVNGDFDAGKLSLDLFPVYDKPF